MIDAQDRQFFVDGQYQTNAHEEALIQGFTIRPTNKRGHHSGGGGKGVVFKVEVHIYPDGKGWLYDPQTHEGEPYAAPHANLITYAFQRILQRAQDEATNQVGKPV
jgi:hypothetical protein